MNTDWGTGPPFQSSFSVGPGHKLQKLGYRCVAGWPVVVRSAHLFSYWNAFATENAENSQLQKMCTNSSLHACSAANGVYIYIICIYIYTYIIYIYIYIYVSHGSTQHTTLHYITLHYCTGTPDTMNIRNIHIHAVVLPGNTAAAFLSSLENWALSLQTFQARRKAIAFFRRKRQVFFKALVVVMWQTHVDTIYMILYVCKSNHQLIGNPFKWWNWGCFSLFGPSCNQCKAMPFWGYPPCPTTEGMWAGLEMPYPGSGWLLPQHCHQPMVQQSGWVEASFRKEGPGNRKLLISLARCKYISISLEIIFIYM